MFSGPGFLVAQEIGDAAHGGQVAVSHDAWLELRNNMDQVLPAVRQLSLWVLVVSVFSPNTIESPSIAATPGSLCSAHK